MTTWEAIEAPIDFDKTRDELQGLSLRQLAALSFADLARFKASGKFPPSYPADTAVFYSPRDLGVHAVDCWVALQVTHSWHVNMYGMDDPLVAALTKWHTEDPNKLVVVNLDKSQAGGKHEKEILQIFNHDEVGNSIAIGHSTRSAISHLKITIADGRVKSGGSTNMSQGGEEAQDNELVVTTNPLIATEAVSVVGLNHDAMLAQMAKAAVTTATPVAA